MEEPKEFKTLDDLQCDGKTVLVRVDINAPYNVQTGKIEDNERFVVHAVTVKELAKKNAKVVILAHQGGAGDEDFTTLEQHAEILSGHLRKKVKYVSDTVGLAAQNEIKKLKPGKIILLENTRFLAEETLDKNFEKTIFVKTLAPLCDFFVNDAFSAAHRAQTSMVGFPKLLPSYAGRVMEREYTSIAKVLKNIQRPSVYILGGAKPDDVFKLMKYALENNTVDHILTSGVIGELCLIAKGNDLGMKRDWLKEKGFDSLLPEVEKLVKNHDAKIETPTDFAFVDNDGIRVEIPVQQIGKVAKPVFDVGSATAKRYGDYVKQAKTVYVKGPLGKFEELQFELGTKIVFQALEKTKAFTLMGGGHTLTALDKFGIPKKKISHISIAGGALLEMLQGKPLPAVEALKSSSA
ncbi:MAG: phosphoglycerate kinase [Candidatus Micrarchaeota archaeon]